LLLISALEHRVVILGDSGIHAMLGDQGFQEYVKHLVGRLRERQAAKGIFETLERLEELLAHRVPGRADDTNELSDAVIRR
jgi:putative membrane protein